MSQRTKTVLTVVGVVGLLVVLGVAGFHVVALHLIEREVHVDGIVWWILAAFGALFALVIYPDRAKELAGFLFRWKRGGE